MGAIREGTATKEAANLATLTRHHRPLNDKTLISGPKLRAALGISPVTLWRWRHSKRSGFPTAKTINGRLYFYWPDIQAWLDKQPVAA
jgi:hypothetical protein